MFAYCGNNPVNCSDPTGQFPWILAIVAVVSGGVAALAEFAQGGTLSEIGWAFLKGAASGLLIYLAPEMAYVILGFDIANTYFDYRNEGYSMEKSAATASTNIVSSISPFETGDFAVDQMTHAVFGSGFAISAAGLEQLAAGKEKPSGQTRINNQQQFRNNVCGGLIVMGGLGAARYTCHSDGGDCYVRL